MDFTLDGVPVSALQHSSRSQTWLHVRQVVAVMTRRASLRQAVYEALMQDIGDIHVPPNSQDEYVECDDLAEAIERVANETTLLSKRTAQNIVQQLVAEPPEESESSESFVEQPIKKRPKNVETLTQVANALCNIYTAVPDNALRANIAASLRIYEMQMAPLFETPEAMIRVSDRVLQLYPNAAVSAVMLQNIGKKAAVLYQHVYGQAPQKVAQQVGDAIRMINVYTERTAHNTLDVAIEQAFHE